MIITLDGPSGTGKSTLAKIVANKLNFKFLNSGMIYRAITYYYLSNGISASNIDKIESTVMSLNIKLEFIDNNQHVFINGEDYTSFVSLGVINENVSLFSQILKIRSKVLEIQRRFASKNDIVIEGRDVGTEVFPNAEYKFYVTCDIMVRAKRRYNDLKKQYPSVTLDNVVESLKNRDYLDSTRKHSPLVRPSGAIDIDTSVKNIDECVLEVLSYLQHNCNMG